MVFNFYDWEKKNYIGSVYLRNSNEMLINKVKQLWEDYHVMNDENDIFMFVTRYNNIVPIEQVEIYNVK